MAEYKMTKMVSGNKYVYQFYKDGKLHKIRRSARNYVAVSFWTDGSITPHTRKGLIGTKSYANQVLEGSAVLME